MKQIGRLGGNRPRDVEVVERADVFISSGPEYTRRMMRCFDVEARRFAEVGNPRNDLLARPPVGRESALRAQVVAELDLPETASIVLYAPTWRRDESVRLFPFSDLDLDELDRRLEGLDLCLVVRRHPFDRAPVQQTRRVRVVHHELDPLDAQQWLLVSRVLVSDYSSIVYDYLLLDRPVIRVAYDKEIYRQSQGFLVEPDEEAVGPSVHSQESFLSALEEAVTAPTRWAAARDALNRLVNPLEDGQATSRVLDLIDALSRRPRITGGRPVAWMGE